MKVSNLGAVRPSIAASLALFAALAAVGWGQTRVDGAPLAVHHTQNTATVPPYEVFEIAFRHDRRYENPFFDVTIEVTFTSPSGQRAQVGGFHYGSTCGPAINVRQAEAGHGGRTQAEYVLDKQDLWKARFAPAELGRWSYAYVLANLHGEKAVGAGSFQCVQTRVHNPGFVRQHPTNPFRWVFDDGGAYFPIGLQECVGDNFGVGSVLAAMSMEGPFRLDRNGRPDPPPGAIFQPGPANNPVNGDYYFRNYARAGFNLFRFSQKNCSFALYRDLDHYLVQEGVMTDELLRCVRKYGFRVFYGLFGYQPVFNDRPENAEGMAKLKRFAKYAVDRWGAYVDFWEFLNEQKADARWYEIMTPYLRSVDPYRHPITTSWERPELPGIEINAPHWYAGIKDELNCDTQAAHRAAEWRKFNKPVIVGEQGNSATKEQLETPGIGGVWDIGSSRRMRIRNWTALFNEIAFIFWATSYAKDGHNMNIWLGPQERQYVRAMQDFAYRLDKDVRMAPVAVSEPNAVRAYGLASPHRAGVYLHHFTSHTEPVRGLAVTLDAPKSAKGYWYSPENAAILARVDAPAGRRTFTAPEFAVDIALLITPAGPPDIDHDGIPNDLDDDDDNDGAPDKLDAFPLDPEEWADKDGDLIGDNMDADIDADGRGDDRNNNAIPDHDELDLDGDGVPKARAIPWDAFPLNSSEWRDTDGDGIGDNADPDKDGDGWTDEEERKAGADPLDKLSFPMSEILMVFALKLMFVTDIREDASSALIRFDDGREGRLWRDGENYAEFLERARERQNRRWPVVVTVAKPDRIIEIETADSDTVKSVEEGGADKLEVWFLGHAAKYFVRKDNPDFGRVRAVLERSAKDQSLAWLSFQQHEKVIVDALPVEQNGTQRGPIREQAPPRPTRGDTTHRRLSRPPDRAAN